MLSPCEISVTLNALIVSTRMDFKTYEKCKFSGVTTATIVKLSALSKLVDSFYTAQIFADLCSKALKLAPEHEPYISKIKKKVSDRFSNKQIKGETK